ncbi:MAG: DUF3078 domain-containing protein [Saprospiraceae bacterium]
MNKFLMSNLMWTLVLIFSLEKQLVAQQRISGTILNDTVPAKEISISIKSKNNISAVRTNEKGEFYIEIPNDIHKLILKDPANKKAVYYKLNPSITDQILLIDLEKLRGKFSWSLDASAALASSYFSTYQVSDNSNNFISAILDAEIYLEWIKGKNNWLTDLRTLYGQNHTFIRVEDSVGIAIKGITSKSGDNFSLTTKYGHELSKHLYLTGLGNFQSQFTAAYQDPFAEATGKSHKLISDFLSPAIFNLGLGLDYRPFDGFSLYYSPCNLDILVVQAPGLRSHFNVFDGPAVFEFGSFLKFDFKKEIMRNISFTTSLQLFTNYLKNKKHPEAERVGSIDVQLWQNSLGFHFNKYFSLTIHTSLMYDEDEHFELFKADKKDGIVTGKTGPRTQYFQNIGLSVGYIFSNNKKHYFKKEDNEHYKNSSFKEGSSK